MKIPLKPTYVTISTAMEEKALDVGSEARHFSVVFRSRLGIYMEWEMDPGSKRDEVRTRALLWQMLVSIGGPGTCAL